MDSTIDDHQPAAASGVLSCRRRGLVGWPGGITPPGLPQNRGLQHWPAVARHRHTALPNDETRHAL